MFHGIAWTVKLCSWIGFGRSVERSAGDMSEWNGERDRMAAAQTCRGKTARWTRRRWTRRRLRRGAVLDVHTGKESRTSTIGK